MRNDDAITLLGHANPVREEDLPGPRSVEARALEERILLGGLSAAGSRIADRSRPPRQVKVAFRLAAVATAAAAIGFGTLSALPGGGPSAVARAEAALSPADGTILHTVVLTTTTQTDGSTSSGTTETWQQTSPPYDERQISGSGDHRRELATANGRPQYYDARTNTIQVVPPQIQVPPRRSADGSGNRLLDNLRGFLASGEAREDGRAVVDGREAIRIVYLGGTMTLLVDADSYEPIEWTTVSDEGIRETSRFQVYELLPATRASLALLSLRAQHPNATIDPSASVEGF